MGSGPKSPNNEFVENGRKNQSEYREKILVDSVKGKEILMHKYKKHLQIYTNSMINNMELFLFTVVFLQPFTLFLFFFFRPPSFFPLFVLYTMVFVPFSPSTCESGVGSFFCPRSSLLESSTLSCKAACLLFRHHLHINSARELAGQHLMRRQQCFQIFVIPHPYPLSGISSSSYYKALPICYIMGLRRFLTTTDRGSEMVIILGHS